MLREMKAEELEAVEGGCGWCYVGGALVIVGGFLVAGWGGAFLAGLGVVGVILT